MQHNPKMLLAAVATSDYLDKAKQLFASAHEAGYWQGDYMLLSPGISPKDRNWFESRGILVKDCPPVMSDEEWSALRKDRDKASYNALSKVVLTKYYLFCEEFKAWDKIVYMDCDIIVTGPIIRLAQVNGFNAIIDCPVFLKNQFFKNTGCQLLIENRYDPNSHCFNSGVFAFSTDIISPGLYEELIVLSRRFLPFAAFNDQAILNLYFHKKWRKLSMAYNFLIVVTSEVPFCRSGKALVLHFAGAGEERSIPNPWSSKSPYRLVWEKNLTSSETINFRIKKSLNFRLKWSAYKKEKLFIPWTAYVLAMVNFLKRIT